MDQLFGEEIHRAIMHDPRTRTGKTNDEENSPLGYPFGIIQPNVLCNGRVDFSKGYNDAKYGPLSPDDLVLLYCYMNFRGHFHSSMASFKDLQYGIDREFFKRNPIMIDIGCGPATSALALADLHHGEPFTYIGVDAASAMWKRGTALLASAKQKHILHRQSSVSFESGWESLGNKIPTESTVMFNFAYFFASKTLGRRDLQSLAAMVKRVGSQLVSRRVTVSYTNSTEVVSNEKYDEFLDMLDVDRSGRENRKVRYRNRRRSLDVREQNFCRDLYELEF